MNNFVEKKPITNQEPKYPMGTLPLYPCLKLIETVSIGSKQLIYADETVDKYEIVITYATRAGHFEEDKYFQPQKMISRL